MTDICQVLLSTFSATCFFFTLHIISRGNTRNCKKESEILVKKLAYHTREEVMDEGNRYIKKNNLNVASALPVEKGECHASTAPENPPKERAGCGVHISVLYPVQVQKGALVAYATPLPPHPITTMAYNNIIKYTWDRQIPS